MSRLGRATAIFLAAAAASLLTACSPTVDAVSAVGYDAQGRLIGALKVCHGGFRHAHLTPSAPGDVPDIGAWKRLPGLRGATETWPMRDSDPTPWVRTSSGVPVLEPATQYVFWANDKDGGRRSNFLLFYGRDLETLNPGEVLVSRPGPVDADGYYTRRLVTISLDRLAQEKC